MMNNISSKPGIYIHIPFCQSKCSYCDFYSTTTLNYKDTFIKALLKEIELLAGKIICNQPFDTVYIGGGTPSLLNIDDIACILKILYKKFNITNNAEITIEINPGTVTNEKLVSYLSLGINRLSIGIQSFLDKELQNLGRIHTSQEAESTVQMARETGFQNINLDLIYALPGQSINDWIFTLNRSLSFYPEHISAYNLQYEHGTAIYKKMLSGDITLFDEATEIQFYKITRRLLKENRYINYEISNFAKTGQNISRHNFKYWTHTPYIGFGPSAHSFWAENRWANVNSIQQYSYLLNKNRNPVAFKENLQKKDILFETIMLRLRTFLGIDLSLFQLDYGVNFLNKYSAVIKNLINKHLAVIKNNHFKLTNKGMILCDEILPEFAEI